MNHREKLWEVRGPRLSPNFATRRLRGMTLRSLFFELFLPGKKTTHIDGVFLYPRGGYGRIVQNLESTLPRDSLPLAHEIVRLPCESGATTRIHFPYVPLLSPPARSPSPLPLTLLSHFPADH